MLGCVCDVCKFMIDRLECGKCVVSSMLSDHTKV